MRRRLETTREPATTGSPSRLVTSTRAPSQGTTRASPAVTMASTPTSSPASTTTCSPGRTSATGRSIVSSPWMARTRASRARSTRSRASCIRTRARPMVVSTAMATAHASPAKNGDRHGARIRHGLRPARRRDRAAGRGEHDERVRVRRVAAHPLHAQREGRPREHHERYARDVGHGAEQTDGRREDSGDDAQAVDDRRGSLGAALDGRHGQRQDPTRLGRVFGDDHGPARSLEGERTGDYGHMQTRDRTRRRARWPPTGRSGASATSGRVCGARRSRGRAGRRGRAVPVRDRTAVRARDRTAVRARPAVRARHGVPVGARADAIARLCERVAHRRAGVGDLGRGRRGHVFFLRPAARAQVILLARGVAEVAEAATLEHGDVACPQRIHTLSTAWAESRRHRRRGIRVETGGAEVLHTGSPIAAHRAHAVKDSSRRAEGPFRPWPSACAGRRGPAAPPGRPLRARRSTR